MFELQAPPVEAIFPQASADTSNTDSNLNEGALYGFFAAGAAGSSVLSLSVFSVFKCYAPNLHLLQTAWPGLYRPLVRTLL